MEPETTILRCAHCSASTPGWPESMRWCQPEVAGERRYTCPACCRCRWHACGAHADNSPDCLHCYFALQALRDGVLTKDDGVAPVSDEHRRSIGD